MQSLFGKRSKSARTATKGRSRPVRILGLSSSPNISESAPRPILPEYHTTSSTFEARNKESTQEHSILNHGNVDPASRNQVHPPIRPVVGAGRCRLFLSVVQRLQQRTSSRFSSNTPSRAIRCSRSFLFRERRMRAGIILGDIETTPGSSLSGSLFLGSSLRQAAQSTRRDPPGYGRDVREQ